MPLNRGSQKGGRMPTASTGPGALPFGALMTVSGALFLAACGGGGGSQMAATSRTGSTSPSPGGSAKAQSACKTVPAPRVHSAARAAKPSI
ncbi:MAG: hypothetical protein ACYDA6_09825, partial [Solirubrobacteraceae bacterium]